MSADVRRECKQCGVHTFKAQCGNCGGMDLCRVEPVMGDVAPSRRFARASGLALAQVAGGRGLRSGSAIRL